MKKIYLVIFFWVLVLFNSCSVLTNSQIKNINAFATSAKNYSNFPGEIIKKRAELVFQEKLIGSIQLSSEQIKKSIAEAQENYKNQLQLADMLDISLQLIQQYSSLLSKLSSEKFVEDLSGNTNDLNDNLGDLVKIANSKLPNKIPPQVGDAITKVIFLVGGRLTKNKQAKALKEFIPQGDTLIKVTVKNLVDALSSDLPGILVSDKEKFINTYTNIILSRENRVDYNSLNQYLITLNDYDNLEQLRKNCIDAANKLSIAHSKINANIHAKSDIKEIFKETQDLIVSIQDLYKIFGKLSSKKQS
jgi:hypothetical protein